MVCLVADLLVHRSFPEMDWFEVSHVMLGARSESGNCYGLEAIFPASSPHACHSIRHTLLETNI